MPIVPQAICFDLLNGGDKDWDRYPPYRELAYAACESARSELIARQRRRGLRRDDRESQGRPRLGKPRTRSGHVVAALAVVNAIGSARDR